MFYKPQDGHPFAHNPFNALVTPRPIGWISTRSGDGVSNLAPYSFFNAVAYVPPQVMFASTGEKADQDGTKDSVANIRETGVFCVNVVEEAAKDVMNISSGDWARGDDEFVRAGLTATACDTIDCSRVEGAPAALECKMTHIVKVEGAVNYVVFGTVTGIHIRDDCLVDGKFDATRYKPLARMGYRDYAVVRDVFELKRPGE